MPGLDLAPTSLVRALLGLMERDGDLSELGPRALRLATSSLVEPELWCSEQRAR